MGLTVTPEVLNQAKELYLTDALFYNRVNRAVTVAEREYLKFTASEHMQRWQLSAMKTAAAVAIILATPER